MNIQTVLELVLDTSHTNVVPQQKLPLRLALACGALPGLSLSARSTAVHRNLPFSGSIKKYAEANEKFIQIARPLEVYHTGLTQGGIPVNDIYETKELLRHLCDIGLWVHPSAGYLFTARLDSYKMQFLQTEEFMKAKYPTD